MDIASAKKQIKDTVEAYLARDEAGLHRLSPARQRPVLLMGAPGIGKTAIMEQIAQELGIGIVSYSMTHHTRQSALGLPRIVHYDFEGFEYDASEYTMSEIVSAIYDYMAQSGLRQGILFLDEINCVSETLYPSMLQFLQFKTFGRHAIPADWVIVCAGNPPEYNRSVHTFDIVTLDRLREIDVEPEYEAWKRYAQEKGIHPAVTTFLEAKRNCFYSVETKPGGEKSFVTARGWEDLAEVIGLYEEMGKPIDRDLVGQFLRDEEIADRFAVYYNLFDKYRSDYQVLNILAGKAGRAILNRAKKAEFDERIALIGLIIDALGESCAEALEREAVTLELRDELRRAKPILLEGGSVADAVAAPLAAREEALQRKIDAHTIGSDDLRIAKMTIERLRAFIARCDMLGAHAGQHAFDTLSEQYRSEVELINPGVEATQSQIDNAFEFLDAAYGSGREMLVFLAELTTRQTTTQFIAHYGSEGYYAHNSELQVDQNRTSLAERIKELRMDEGDSTDTRAKRGSDDDMGLSTAADAQAPKPTERELAAYYDGRQFEYGFASMSRMNLPTTIMKGMKVLDVACRRGKGVYKISSKVGSGGIAIGVDWSEQYIKEAEAGSVRAAHDNGLPENNMDFMVAYPEDLLSAGIGASSIDMVYINNVATLLYDQQAAYAEFARVLKPNGVFVLETILTDREPNPEVVEAARGIGNSIQAAGSRETLVDTLTKAGFKQIDFLDSFEVPADEGFKKGVKAQTVPGDEDVVYSAVLVHAYKE
ncbi:MAG: methyltransferase domain-containing protein [Coriobacteriales bacterium]|jgi:SAM-dependent methyltransferase